MRGFKYRQSDLDHVRSLLNTALGPLVSPKYDYHDGDIEAMIDWAESRGCCIEDAVTAHAKIIILVTAHSHGGMQ